MRAHKKIVLLCAGATAAVVTVSGCSGSSGNAASSEATAPTAASAAAPTSAATTAPTGQPSVSTSPSTPAAQQSSGGVDERVPSQRMTTLPAVPLTSRANFGSGITGRIEKVSPLTTTTRLPGEVGGPSIAVTVALTNRSGKALPVSGVVVDLLDSTMAPATSVSTAPSKPFTGSIGTGASARAVYVFSIAKDRRRPVSVTVNYAASAPIARFVGNVN